MSEEVKTVFEKERERVLAEREAYMRSKAGLDDRIAALDRELAALDAYERAKNGKAAPAQRTHRARTGTRGMEILDAVRNASGGMTRGELIEAFGVKGDQSIETSISNALARLTKAGALMRSDGRYWLPEMLSAAA